MKKKLISSFILTILTLGLSSNVGAEEISSISSTEKSKELFQEQSESSNSIIMESTEETESINTLESDRSSDESEEESARSILDQEEKFEYVEDPLKYVDSGQNKYNLSRAATATGISMYRLYNPNNYEHFYTASKAEKDHLVKIGWGKYEGVGWTAPTTGDKVYRLYNKTLRDHHYTMDWNEVKVLTSKHGWTYEGEAWKSNKAKKQPVYRLFHPGLRSGSHHYTLSKNERDTLKKRGWRYEGIAWYAGADTGTATPSNPAPKPVWKYTTFYEGYETTAYDIKAGKNIYDTKAQAVKAIDKYADDLLINNNISARRYGVQDWQVK